MKNKFIYIFVFIFLLIISIGLVILLKTPPIELSQLKIQSEPHLYNNPQISLRKINLLVFYVSPPGLSSNNWYENIKEVLEKIKAFHYLQFKKLSIIDYKIYPQPLIFDIKNKQSFEEGNHNLLKAIKIAEEIETQIIQKKIDKNFIPLSNNSYNVLGIIYEGAGLYGGLISEKKISLVERNFTQETSLHKFQGFVFISIDYLTKEGFKKIGPTLFYHELAHTFGIPDQYDPQQIFSLDIMGRGRWEILENNYLDHQTLVKMGIQQ